MLASSVIKRRPVMIAATMRGAFLIAVASLLIACSAAERLRSLRPTSATAHERYAQSLVDAGLDSTALGRDWLAASDSAIRAPLEARLPAREVGVYSRVEARAVAYRVSLRDGQRLVTTLETEGLPALLYLDLYEITGDSVRPFIHRATADTAVARSGIGRRVSLAYEATRDADFVLRMQPELLRGGRFELTLEAEPSLLFPVDGRGNGAIQSFFGVDRDGGRRVHHGIDIFAPRGTPVLAAADGVVRSVSPNNLGGNVVWLNDERRNQSLYYAHLDSHAVRAGQRVRVGDTLGFVGNTGNARTTAPHLHFGIYRRGRGPIDPLAHVRLIAAEPPPILADTARLGQPGLTRIANATLRDAPHASSSPLRELPNATAVQIMAANDRWYRVQCEDGTAGYLIAGALRTVEN